MSLKVQTDSKHIFNLLLGSLPSKVLFEDGNYSVFGTGSTGLATRIQHVNGKKLGRPTVVIGNYCEYASGVKLLSGGEHSNSQIFNNTMSSSMLARLHFKETYGNFHQAKSYTTTIGSASVISTNALILSGATLGHNCVVAAGAVVTKSSKFKDFSILGGVPARYIKMRLDEDSQRIAMDLCWWNWQPKYIKEYGYLLRTDPKQLIGKICSEWLVKNDSFMILRSRAEGGSKTNKLTLVGIEINGEFTEISKTSTQFQEYFAQLSQSGLNLSITVRDDPFSLL